MAKKTATLEIPGPLTAPPLEEPRAALAETPPAEPLPGPTSDRPPARERRVTLSLPLRECPERPRFRHVDLRLNARRRRALRALLDGLDGEHARTGDGKPVSSAAQAVYYLLDQVAAKLPPE